MSKLIKKASELNVSVYTFTVITIVTIFVVTFTK